MFLGIILFVWTTLHVYVFWRISSIPLVAQRVPGKAVLATGVVLWSMYFLVRIVEGTGIGWLARALEIVGANWIGVLFLCFVCMLAADIVTGFGYLLPRWAPWARSWALVAAGVLSVIAFIQAARAPEVRSYEVQIASLPREYDGLVVVAGSDFHLGSMLGQKWLAARVEQIEALRPDLIILAGDIVEGHGGSEHELLPVLRRLSARLGVWAVNGNHETYGPTGGDRLLEQAGFHLLRDQWVEVQPGLILAGVDDLTARRRRLGRYAGFVDKGLAGRPAGAATIFVSHTPWPPTDAAAKGIGLMISGHTHNGQIWPFTYVVGLTYPLLSGRYDVAGLPVIVCRGTGTWGPRMRLWQRGELVRITLRAPAKIARLP